MAGRTGLELDEAKSPTKSVGLEAHLQLIDNVSLRVLFIKEIKVCAENLSRRNPPICDELQDLDRR